MVPNLAVRWLTFGGVAGLAVDAALVIFISWRLGCWRRGAGRGGALGALEYAITACACIVASSLILSGGHALSGWGFLWLHAVVAGALAVEWRWHARGGATGRDRGTVGREVSMDADASGMAKWVRRGGMVLVGLLVAYALVLAVGTFATNWDSQTYRLPRVGAWLQERHLSWDFEDDVRLVYMPCNSELLMAWCAGFFPAGYPLANLPQFVGGCVTVLATLELGRLAGLGASARWLAALVVLAMPNFYLQMATSQSDLVAGGLLNAGLVFLWHALRSRGWRDALLAGLAFGLAVGTKGTVFYWVPGLALWVGLLAWSERAGWRRTVGMLGAIGAITVVVGGWKYADNYRRYGNPLAPQGVVEDVNKHDGSGRLATAWYVAQMHGWQLFQANSNPRFAAGWLAGPAGALARHLDRSAPSRELGATGQSIRGSPQQQFVGEDDVSFGLLAVALLVPGLASSIYEYARRGSADAGRRLAMAGALVLYFAFFFTQMKLNGWNFRYFTMVAPFLAVLGASWPQRRAGALAVAAAAMMLAAYEAVDFQARNGLGGWRALGPQAGPGLFESLQNQALEATPAGARIAVVLPVNGWLSPYYRMPGGRKADNISCARVQAGYRSPRDFLDRAGADALIALPDLFAREAWTGTKVTPNGHTGIFACVVFTPERREGR